MFPKFQLFGATVHSYGVFLSLAYLSGVGLLLWRVHRRRLPIEPYIDLIFAVMFLGLVGARAGYVLERPSEYTNAWDWIYFWRGGLSLFAGFLAAAPAYFFVLRLRRLPVLQTSDFLAPLLPLSLALCRLGCLAAGCCYGQVTNLPWAIRLREEMVHPTQAYEALFLFILAGVLWWQEGKNPKPGTVAILFPLLYSSYRLATNGLRADHVILYWGWASGSQIAAFILLFASLIAYWIIARAPAPVRN